MINWCPSIWDSAEYNVIVLGHVWPPVSGCAVKKGDQFNVRLMNPQEGIRRHCSYKDDLDMASTHMAYDCVTSWKAPNVNNDSIPSRNISFMLIRNQSAAKIGIHSYQCALIESVTTDSKKLLMAISADEHCDGLADRLLKPDDHHVKDGNMVMLLYQNARRPPQLMDRPKREATDEQCRFSNFAQGEWLDLRVDGGTAQYMHVVHKDEIADGDQKGDDETGQQTRIRRQIYRDPTVLDGDEIRISNIGTSEKQRDYTIGMKETNRNKRSYLWFNPMILPEISTTTTPRPVQSTTTTKPNKHIISQISNIGTSEKQRDYTIGMKETNRNKRSYLWFNPMILPEISTTTTPRPVQSTTTTKPNKHIISQISNIGTSEKQRDYTIGMKETNRNKRSYLWFNPMILPEISTTTTPRPVQSTTTPKPNKHIISQISNIGTSEKQRGYTIGMKETNRNKRSYLWFNPMILPEISTTTTPRPVQSTTTPKPNKHIISQISNIGTSEKQRGYTIGMKETNRNKRSYLWFNPMILPEISTTTTPRPVQSTTTPKPNKHIISQISNIGTSEKQRGYTIGMKETNRNKRSYLWFNPMILPEISTTTTPRPVQSTTTPKPNKHIISQISNIGTSEKQRGYTIGMKETNRNKRSYLWFNPMILPEISTTTTPRPVQSTTTPKPNKHIISQISNIGTSEKQRGYTIGMKETNRNKRSYLWFNPMILPEISTTTTPRPVQSTTTPKPNKHIISQISNIGTSEKQRDYTIGMKETNRNKRSYLWFNPMILPEISTTTTPRPVQSTTTPKPNKHIISQQRRNTKITDLQLPTTTQIDNKRRIQKRSILSDITNESDHKTLYDAPISDTDIPFFPNQKIPKDKGYNGAEDDPNDLDDLDNLYDLQGVDNLDDFDDLNDLRLNQNKNIATDKVAMDVNIADDSINNIRTRRDLPNCRCAVDEKLIIPASTSETEIIINTTEKKYKYPFPQMVPRGRRSIVNADENRSKLCVCKKNENTDTSEREIITSTTEKLYKYPFPQMVPRGRRSIVYADEKGSRLCVCNKNENTDTNEREIITSTTEKEYNYPFPQMVPRGRRSIVNADENRSKLCVCKKNENTDTSEREIITSTTEKKYRYPFPQMVPRGRRRRQVRGGLWRAIAPEIMKSINSMLEYETTSKPIQVFQKKDEHNIFATTTETIHKYKLPQMVPRGKRSVSDIDVIAITEFDKSDQDLDYEKNVIQPDNARSKRSLSGVMATSHPIPSGPTPPPSPPPTPPHTPPRTSSSFHSIYNSLFEAKDLIKSFDILIEEYEQLINNDKKNLETRKKRSFTQQTNPTKFSWRCVKSINSDDTSFHQSTGAKFLAWGGQVEEQVDESGNRQLDNENNSTPVNIGNDYNMTYGCLWFIPRGPNVLEYSVVDTGLPKPDQDLKSFARELCKDNKSGNLNFDVNNRKNLNPHRQWWFTEPRTIGKSYVPIQCPVLPGTLFYGVVPAPPPPPPAAVAAAIAADPEVEQRTIHQRQYCAMLVSSADDCCNNGKRGSTDRMKYTVSECVNQDPATAGNPPTSIPPPSAPPSIGLFETTSRGYADDYGGNRRRNKRDGQFDTANITSDHKPAVAVPTSASLLKGSSTVTILTVTSTAETATITSSPSPSQPSNVNTARHQPTDPPSTTSTSTATNAAKGTSSTPNFYHSGGSNDGSNSSNAVFVDVTVATSMTAGTAPTTGTATTTATSRTTAMPAVTANQQQQETMTMPPGNLPPRPGSPSTTTSPRYYPTVGGPSAVNDYYYRQQQQQQQRQQWQNNNDYYHQERQQQQYTPPPPRSTSVDYNNYYYRQRQQPQQWPSVHQQPQQWPVPQHQQPHYQWPAAQQQPQPQYQWTPGQQQWQTSQQPNVYHNGYQPQTMGPSSGRRTDDYYYRQQQQNYHYQQPYMNNGSQSPTSTTTPLTPMSFEMANGWRNGSFAGVQSNGAVGSWNVHGDRPLYVSGSKDNVRDIPVLLNSTVPGVTGVNGGGWTTAAQQHWWQQQQSRQQQNNRAAGGILSLPPVQLPPLQVDQATVTGSTGPLASIPGPAPSPLLPQQLHRQQKPANHYYQPTPSTKTTVTSPPPPTYRLMPKSESRYYEDREYQCLGEWSEQVQQSGPTTGDKTLTYTYIYVKRVDPGADGTAVYECFVVTTIANDPGQNTETTTTILLTEAGTGTRCSRQADPYMSGMKLVGTKTRGPYAEPSSAPTQVPAGGSWHPVRPQKIPSPSVVGADNAGGKWYAAPPVPVQSPTAATPIITGRQPWKPTGSVGNGNARNVAEKQSQPPPFMVFFVSFAILVAVPGFIHMNS